MRETVNTSEKPQAKPREWIRITAFIALCLLVMTGAAIGLQMLKTKEATHQEAVRLAQRKGELMDNHVRITDDFTRPRIYAHKILKMNRDQKGATNYTKSFIYNTDVSEDGALLVPSTINLIVNSMKVLANDDLYEMDPSKDLADGLKRILLAEKPHIMLFKIRSNNDPQSDFTLEGPELKAFRETLELSDILKSQKAAELKKRK